MGLSLKNRLRFSFVKSTHPTYRMLFEILPFALYTSPLPVQDAYLTYLMLQRQLSHLTAVSLTNAKFKPLLLSMSGFALSYTTNMFILMTLYDLCLSPAQFYYIIVYIRKAETRVQIADRCAPWKISTAVHKINWALNIQVIT
jgi:hypothetical protein